MSEIAQSPEAVAFALLQVVATVECKSLQKHAPSGETKADKAWVLDTYAECLSAAKGEAWKR